MDWEGDAFVPSESILQFKAMSLERSRAAHQRHKSPLAGRRLPSVDEFGLYKVLPPEGESAEHDTLRTLYDKHEGDLEKIFAELGDNPSKAQKYPPADRDEFAKKYILGYYTYIDLEQSMAKAGLEFRRPPSPPSRELSHIYDEPPTFAGVVRTKHSQSSFEITPAEQDAAANTPLPVSRQSSGSSASSASSSSTTGRPEPSKPKKSSPKKGSRPGTPQRATRPAAGVPGGEGSKPPAVKKELTPEELVEAEELAKLEAFAKQHENMGDGSDGSSNDFRGVGVGALQAGRLTLQRRSSRPALAGTNLMWSSSGVGAKDEETAPLIALYYDHDGDLKSIFKELGESPRKALKHPPKDAQDFALKYISGKLSDYAAPKVDPGWEEQMMRPDKPRTHLQALASVFPGLPHEVLFAVLEAANGSLDGAVHLLLDSGAHLSDDYHPDDQQAPPAPVPPPPPEAPPPPPAPLSELQRRRLEQGAEAEAEDDFVLAINVPQGSRPNALLKITTTVGTVHARVPPNVRPGQTFFIRMRRGGHAS